MGFRNAFPTRDLIYTPPFLEESALGALVSTVVIVALYATFATLIGAPLIVDSIIGGDYRIVPNVTSADGLGYGYGAPSPWGLDPSRPWPIQPNGQPEARISDGCRPLFILQWCSVEMSYREYERDALVLFFGSEPRFRLGVTESGWLVGDAAQRRLGERWLIAGPPLLCFGYLGAREVRRLWRERPVGLTQATGRFGLVEIALEKTTPNYSGYLIITYRPVAGGRRTTVSARGDFEPLILLEPAGEPPIALAVRQDAQSHALLLDRDLLSLDLTDAEREVLTAAISEERPGANV